MTDTSTADLTLYAASHEAMPAPTETAPAEPASVLAPSRMSILGGVELKVEVVLGRARRTLAELAAVRPNQTIELDRQRNSPAEVLVNGKTFAYGEIVVIDETKLGVRIVELVAGQGQP